MTQSFYTGKHCCVCVIAGKHFAMTHLANSDYKLSGGGWVGVCVCTYTHMHVCVWGFIVKIVFHSFEQWKRDRGIVKVVQECERKYTRFSMRLFINKPKESRFSSQP